MNHLDKIEKPIVLALFVLLGIASCSPSVEKIPVQKQAESIETMSLQTSTPAAIATLTPTQTSMPVPTNTPTRIPTQTLSAEVFGPIPWDEAWALIAQDYRQMDFNDLTSQQSYCEELIIRADHPEFGPDACEFSGVARGFDDISINGWLIEFPRDYTNMIMVEPNVMQHKDGPRLIDCSQDPPPVDEKVFIYETSSRTVRIIFTWWDFCLSP